ncbi:SMI1/KNR4 family protein, partial [Kocuria sp.]|uniref:SMI1/KNR4 family protein n=1 Tax=Kocuria sp. TaxID=1871328 RepID=UPI0026DF5A9E
PGPWNPGWVPITDDGMGNALIIDTTPGPNGHTGQILSITTNGHTQGLAYPNLATLLNTYLQNNNYVHGE